MCRASQGIQSSRLLQLTKEVNDLLRSNTCCDDENMRIGGNTSLPEQHFFLTTK
jgi:hypothetical protein